MLSMLECLCCPPGAPEDRSLVDCPATDLLVFGIQLLSFGVLLASPGRPAAPRQGDAAI
jgi:hypothetical protein